MPRPPAPLSQLARALLVASLLLWPLAVRAQDPMPGKLVPPGAVKRLSGELPPLSSSNIPQKPIVSARLCIDVAGAVFHAKLPDDLDSRLKTKLEAALKGWKYQPFIANGQAIPVCFASILRLTANK